MSFSRKALLVLSVAALFAGPVAPVLHLGGLDYDIAHAKSGNGGGGGKGGSDKSQGNSGGSKSGSAKSDGAKSGGSKSGGSKSGGSKSGGAEASASAADVDSGETEPGTSRGKSGKSGKGAVASELKGLNAAHASANALANANADSRVGRIATYMTAMQAADALAGDLEDEIETAEDAVDGLLNLDDAGKVENFPVFDQAAYDAAVDAADGDADEYARLTALTEEEIATEYPNPEDYQAALQAAAGNPEELASLTALTTEEKRDLFRLANSYDVTAYEAAIAAAQSVVDGLNAQIGDAEQAELEAYAAMTDGRTLSADAQDALIALLDGKSLTADQAEAVDEVLAQN